MYTLIILFSLVVLSTASLLPPLPRCPVYLVILCVCVVVVFKYSRVVVCFAIDAMVVCVGIDGVCGGDTVSQRCYAAKIPLLRL